MQRWRDRRVPAFQARDDEESSDGFDRNFRATGRTGRQGRHHLASIAGQRTPAGDWRAKWISEGKEGTLMPAFSAKHGGPLSDEQLASLLDYVTTQLPAEPPVP